MKVVPLYLGFAATGVGLALPGALLPVLLRRWHLGDAQGGTLFLMSFVGASVGALLVRGSLRLWLTLGGLSIAAAALALGLCGGFVVYAAMALYGGGLGMTMTSISLIRQQETGRAGVELVRLNLLWAVGALVCPSLSLGALRMGAIQPMLFSLAGCFVGLAVWAWLQPEVRLEPVGTAGRSWSVLTGVPLALLTMIFLITGIEASIGGWLATYARRGGGSIATVIAAPTCLWAGLLVSRAFWSLRHRWIDEAMVIRGSVALMAIGAMLLIGGGSVVLAAFCMGVGLGPTYPLLLSWALRFERGGAVFFLAGLGSACLPWLTGIVSSWFGSLRSGLLVPMLCCVVMVVMVCSRPLSRWEDCGTEAT